MWHGPVKCCSHHQPLLLAGQGPSPSIGDVLLGAQVSFRWYGEGWSSVRRQPERPDHVYCNVCNPFQARSSIMTSQALCDAVLKDTADFYNGVHQGTLPAVSFVKPSALNDGHPASSKFSISRHSSARSAPSCGRTPNSGLPPLCSSRPMKRAAITTSATSNRWISSVTDQIPLIVVSPFSTGGRVTHSYTDRVSILKFIEANWSCRRSRTQPGQPAKSNASDRQSVCSDEYPGDR